MRSVIIAANWKMNTTPADAGELAATIARRTREREVVRIICPPFVCLAAVRAALEGESVAVGAQNVHHELAGAYTGEISAPMLAGLAEWVIIGHSERRRDAGETDEVIGKKVRRAKDSRLRTILCVGEQLEDRDAGRAEAVVRQQLEGALAGIEAATESAEMGDAIEPGSTAARLGGTLDPPGWLVIAYEPVWAIGTGRNARGADAAAMANLIRQTLTDLGWAAGAEDVPVLYGGSVTSLNIGEFLAEPSIDGALVGGASLKPDEMAGMVARAAVTANARVAGRSTEAGS